MTPLLLVLYILLAVLPSLAVEAKPVAGHTVDHPGEPYSENSFGSLRGKRGLISTRIVGGDAADPTRFPYYTYLRIRTDVGQFQCGGTLIHPDVVMSAGHCYQDFIEQGIDILGISVWVNMTTTWGKTGYEHERHVVRSMMHPEYDYDTSRNDIVLLKLNQTVLFVSLPLLSKPGSDPAPSTTVTAIGQGLVAEQGSFPTSLQVVDVHVIDYEDCNDGDSYNGKVNEDSMICAGVEEGGKDACGGDSGGPLLLKGDFPEDDIIIGITSWGAGCARAEKFGVYAKVSSFDEFVMDGICEMSSEALPSCFTDSPVTPAPVPPPTSTSLMFWPTTAILLPIMSPETTLSPTTPAPTRQPSTAAPSREPALSPSMSSKPSITPSSSPVTNIPSRSPETTLSPTTPAPTRQPSTAAPSRQPALSPSMSFKPSTAPSAALPVSTPAGTAPPLFTCVEWGEPCNVAEDCCSEQCIETNNGGTRCFGPRVGAGARSGLRHVYSRGGAGGQQ